MCDYSLMHMKSRPAAVGDKLVTKRMGSTAGFADPAGSTTEQRVYDEGCGYGAMKEAPCDLAVCLLPGTEVAFADPIVINEPEPGTWNRILQQTQHKVGRFRQIDKDQPCKHHDALELPDGTVVLLNDLQENQTVTVLQLPAAPKTIEEAKEQERLEVVG